MATKTSFHDDLKEKAWLRSGKLLIACGVAAILCWLFIQSAQSSSVTDKSREVLNADILSGPDPDVLAQISGVIITKTHVANFTVGQPGGTFQIQIRNTNPISLTGPLTVTDNLPAGLTLGSFDGIGFTCGPVGGQNVTCTNPNSTGFLSGSLLTLELDVNVASTTASVITNTATLNHAGATISDSDRVNIVTTAGPDLLVNKTVSPSTTDPKVGDTLRYVIGVTNNGSAAATNVVISDTLPSKLNFVSFVATEGSYSTSTRQWTGVSLEVGSRDFLTITATVDSNAYGSVITNTAKVQSSVPTDSNTANNEDSVAVQVQGPDLVAEKTDGKQTVTPNETYNYTISVVNQGTVTAPDYVITDTISDFVTFVTYTFGTRPTDFHYTKSGDLLIWEIGDDLEPDDETVLTVRVRSDSTLPGSTTKIVNRVDVGTSRGETDLTNNFDIDEDTPSGTRNVSISNSVSPITVQTGQNATYTIRVTNNGSAAVTDVKVTDTFSQYVDVTSHSTNRGSRDLSGRNLEVDIGTLNAGQSATITVVVRVNNTAPSNTSVSNTASMTYKFGSQSFSGSASATFSLVRSSTLPGTGGIELPVRPENAPASKAYLVALISTVLLILLGSATIGLSVWARQNRTEWSGFAFRMGLMFIAASLVFGLASFVLFEITGQKPASALTALSKSVWTVKATPLSPADPAWVGVNTQSEPEVLPDFPIPEPTNVPEDENGNKPDTSPINRIAMPIIGVDTVVKYVPYDGSTWLIAGLKEEVAWMGDTSWPGLGGNTALAGHVTLRNGRDGPFRYLDQLQPNDQVYLYTDENIYTYKVRESRVVPEGDMSVITPTNTPQLTLITCINFNAEAGIYMDRLILFADLVDIKPKEVVSR